MTQKRDLDVVVYGATGYTGKLVAEYLTRSYAGAGSPRWAMAGRSLEKLQSVRAELGAPVDTPLIVADASDPASVTAMARRARVVLTTVGPYQLYGEPLVAACAAEGTDYVDLSGEVAWMAAMISAYEAQAKASGARIVFSCGFDSVPFDLGVFFVQDAAKSRFGAPAPHVKGRVRKMQGTFSGGTAASGRATMEAAMKDPKVLATLQSDFALTPGFQGPAQPNGSKPKEDPASGGWVAPFFMAPINTRNVHRSNYLMGHAYGADFLYDEMMMTGPGEQGRQTAEFIAGYNPMADKNGPKPGEGPSKEERDAGFYDLLFIAEMGDGRSVRAAVYGDKDPGYGSTSKMIAECALCLLDEAKDLPGGMWTSAPAFGMAGVARLAAHAGLSFTLEE